MRGASDLRELLGEDGSEETRQKFQHGERWIPFKGAPISSDSLALELGFLLSEGLLGELGRVGLVDLPGDSLREIRKIPPDHILPSFPKYENPNCGPEPWLGPETKLSKKEELFYAVRLGRLIAGGWTDLRAKSREPQT